MKSAPFTPGSGEGTFGQDGDPNFRDMCGRIAYILLTVTVNLALKFWPLRFSDVDMSL